VDIVPIEPEPTDELMFKTSMMNFTSRVDIARHGFRSVTCHLLGEYDGYSEIAERHGIEIAADRVREMVEQFEEDQEPSPAGGKVREEATDDLAAESAG
jgi:hypothetical protein